MALLEWSARHRSATSSALTCMPMATVRGAATSARAKGRDRSARSAPQRSSPFGTSTPRPRPMGLSVAVSRCRQRSVPACRRRPRISPPPGRDAQRRPGSRIGVGHGADDLTTANGLSAHRAGPRLGEPPGPLLRADHGGLRFSRLAPAPRQDPSVRISTVSQFSKQWLCARLTTPIVARPPSPASSPKTSRNRSVQPDETRCTSVNVGNDGDEAERAHDRAHAVREPSAARMPPRQFTPFAAPPRTPAPR